MRAIQVRARFLVVFAIAALIAGQWETVLNYGEHWSRRIFPISPHVRSVSQDTEYFCPMDPGVISAWPSKCGICNMALVRRKVGDISPLPSGVLARMQFSPYRISLAGIRTVPATYQPLTRERILPARLVHQNPDGSVELELAETDRIELSADRSLDLLIDVDRSHRILTGKIRDNHSAVEPASNRILVELGEQAEGLWVGMPIRLRIRQRIDELEPFRLLPTNPPSLKKDDRRSVFTCPSHPETLTGIAGRCPIDGEDTLEPQTLRDNQRLSWWCPLHPKVVATGSVQTCSDCGGKAMVLHIITYRPDGEVLSIPESAVIDTGTRTVVYVERMPGMFDGVEIELGPRCGDQYPVISGIEPGDRVAAAGAFLIDAETRLNPSLATAYFGSKRPAPKVEIANATTDPFASLSIADRDRARSQKICPVTLKPLGSMGSPICVSVAGNPVMICCEGCEAMLRNNPEKYLSKTP